MLNWQIQSHDALCAEIAERAMTRGRVQLIRGEAGIGKTTLAASIARTLAERELVVLPVVGLSELSAVPLAAMSPVLALASSDTEQSVGDKLQRLFSLVSVGEDGAGYVLAIDDGPLLDEISAAAVYQLVRIYGLRCLMTARTDQPLTGPLARLLDEGFVDAVDLAGLDDEQASRAVRGAIGGPVEPTSLGRLVGLAAGNPLFLRELTIAARERDAMRSTSRGLEIDVRRLPTHLRASISDHFAGLGAADRAAVEMLAVASPLPVAALGVDTVQRLGTGLLVTVGDGGAQLAHPLFGEVILADLSREAQQRSRLAAAALLASTSDGDETRYRVLCLRLGSSEPLTSTDLVWSAQYADWLGDRAMSLQLAEAAVAVEATVRSLAALALAFSQLQRWAEAEPCFERAAALAHSEADRVFVAIAHGAHLAYYRSDAGTAVSRGVAVFETLKDAALRDELQTQLDKWRLLDGGEMSAAATAPLSDGGTTLQTAILAAMGAVFVGDIEGATAAIRLGTPLVEQNRSTAPHARELFQFVQIFVFLYQGEMEKARELATSRSREQFNDLSATYAYARGLIELYAGNVVETLDAAVTAVAGLEWLDMAALRMPARALLAAAHARIGDEHAARAQLDAIVDTMRSNGNVLAQSSEAHAWLLARAGRVDEAAAVVSAAADTMAQRGHWGIAASTAHVAVRLGRPQLVVDLLLAASSHSPGPLLAAMTRHATAAVAHSAPELLAAARDLAATGQFGAAVDAADESAALYRLAGDREPERRAALLASGYAAQCSDFRLRRPADRSQELTERERTIAAAAAGRESSKEIAERLGLSVRTVENHLARVYRKLGVASRSDLRQAL